MTGMNDTLTAIPGFRVGHWTDLAGQTGCTVILPPSAGAVTSASFLGPSPATREGVLLSPEKKVERVHGLLLTGGSAFGLSAAGGVVRWLEEQGVGHVTPYARVPIVPAAVIYDLGAGDPGARPNEASGYFAAQQASSGPVARGRVGAGTGASIGKYLGPAHAAAGGLGSAALSAHGVSVGALAVVNPIGDVYSPQGQLLAGPGTGPGASAFTPGDLENTTLVAVVTQHTLTKNDARRLADAAQAALARVIRPSHTYWDGDSAFVLSSSESPPADAMLLGALVQDVVALAVADAVLSQRN